MEHKTPGLLDGCRLWKKHLLKTSSKFRGPSSNELIHLAGIWSEVDPQVQPTASSWLIVIQTRNTDDEVHPRCRGDDGAANCGISALGMIHHHISWPTWSILKTGLLRPPECIYFPPFSTFDHFLNSAQGPATTDTDEKWSVLVGQNVFQPCFECILSYVF